MMSGIGGQEGICHNKLFLKSQFGTGKCEHIKRLLGWEK